MSSLLQMARTWLSGRRVAAPVDPGEEFLKSLNTIVGLDQLLDNFSAKLKEIVDASSLYIVLYEPITNRYTGTKAKGARPELLREFNFMRTDNLIKWLNVNRCALEVTRTPEVVRFLSPQEQEMLRRTNTVLIVPMIVLNRLTGAIFLSPPSGGGTYEPLTIDLLTRLSGQSALALEHSLMYQFQEDKLKKIFHADKLAMVGELAAGAAHEIRNPLTSIRSTVQYLKDDLTQEKRRLVDGIIEEVDRIDHVIKGLLSFSKTSELHMDSVVVDEVLEQTLLLLDSEVRHHGIEVQKSCTPPGLGITGDSSQLKQLFLNLLLNSIQAMPHGGAITITVSDHTEHSVPGRRNDAIRVEIADTGPGIPEENLVKVFDPFFTTKESGTGLGLSIVYGIVGTHGGEIEIKSPANGERSGTTVVIWFPKQAGQS
jgi:signal transduction histidine kinase